MTAKPEQFAGGTLPQAGSNAGLCADSLNSLSGARKIAMRSAQSDDLGFVGVPARGKSTDFRPSATGKCVLR